MAEAYEYTQRVGDLCCWFGQVTKVIPQPGDGLLILGICDCVKRVTGQLKAGETAVCGQALYMDPADGCLTITPAPDCFYGIAKEGVVPTNPANKCPLTVYVAGGFDIEQVVVEGGSVDPLLIKEARGCGIYFEQRV